MKRRTRSSAPTIDAALGYAADRRGNGVCYARVTTAFAQHLVRIPFHVRSSALREREVGYAALTAVTRALLARSVAGARFTVDDPALVDELTEHRTIPETMVLAYVRLRCALNQLDDFSVELAPENDLAQRARAEVALNVAA